MTLYRKKPRPVEAVQWTGDNAAECTTFTGQLFGDLPPEADIGLWVAANSSVVRLPIGQWILKDRLGFYPCSPEIFAETYELAECMTKDKETSQFIEALNSLHLEPMPEPTRSEKFLNWWMGHNRYTYVTPAEATAIFTMAGIISTLLILATR